MCAFSADELGTVHKGCHPRFPYHFDGEPDWALDVFDVHADFCVADVDAERAGKVFNHDGLIELFVRGDGACASCVKGGDDIHFF